MFYRTTKDDNYTKVSNLYLKNENLSLKAKGLFTIILSLPDTWNFSNSGLCSLCKEGKTSVDSAIKELKDNLNFYSKERLTRAENRNKILLSYNMLVNCLELKKFDNYVNEITEILNTYKDLKENIQNNLDDIRAKQKARDIEKRKKLKIELAELLENTSYLRQIELVYNRLLKDDISPENKSKLKQLLNPNNDLSFIWFNNSLISIFYSSSSLCQKSTGS